MYSCRGPPIETGFTHINELLWYGNGGESRWRLQRCDEKVMGNDMMLAMDFTTLPNLQLH